MPGTTPKHKEIRPINHSYTQNMKSKNKKVESIVPLAHSLPPHCLLRSRTTLHSFVRSHRSLIYLSLSSWGKDIERVDFIFFPANARWRGAQWVEMI